MYQKSQIRPLIAIPHGFRSQKQQFKASLKRRSGLTNIIRIYFNFTYYLGISPFRFKRDEDEFGYYYKKMWGPQLAICVFLHILLMFKLVSEVRHLLRSVITTEVVQNPEAYFDMLLTLSDFLYNLLTLKRFWLNSHDYMRAMNVILKDINLPVRDKWVTKPGFVYTLFGFFTLKSIFCFVSGGFEIPISTWTPSWWLRRMVEDSKFLFSFSQPPQSTDLPDLSSVTVWDGFLAVLVGFAHFSRFMLSEFTDLCIIAFALTLWTTANSFASDIYDELGNENEYYGDGQNHSRKTLHHKLSKGMEGQTRQGNGHSSQAWQKIYSNFQAIQNLSEVVNHAVGSQVTWYLTSCLMYYSINMNSLFTQEDMLDKLDTSIFIIVTCVILCISADICIQMEASKLWLSQKSDVNFVPTDEVRLVLLDIVIKDIGIRGSDLFTITWEFVAEYLSLMLTFFVICVEQG